MRKKQKQKQKPLDTTSRLIEAPEVFPIDLTSFSPFPQPAKSIRGGIAT
jgi:hypothetical protein